MAVNSTETYSNSTVQEDESVEKDVQIEEIRITVRDMSPLTQRLLAVMNVVLLFYPLIASLYTYAIFHFPKMTQPFIRRASRI
jgi:hypothetical protein